MPESLTTFIECAFACFISGYGSGILFRFFRQIFETASRPF